MRLILTAVFLVLPPLLLPHLTTASFSIRQRGHPQHAYRIVERRGFGLFMAFNNKPNEPKIDDDSSVTTTPVDAETKPKGGFFDFMTPYQSNIPKSIEAEIFAAEGRTAAAQDRNTRVAIYTSIAVMGILFAFFNGFLSELRTTPNVDGNILTLDETGFGWVVANPISSFLFTNKIGGGLCLVLGGGGGLLAEAEFDTRRLNAERIYEELVRRREKKQQKASGAPATRPKKKRRNKTLEALAEVLAESNDVDISKPATAAPKTDASTLAKIEPTKSENLLDKMKGLYKKADTMAATQALLLNKKLEDQGILEKITDESGLKVIGKAAAASAAAENKDKDPSTSSSEESTKNR